MVIRMRWVVGLDLRPDSQGAVQFGVWLSKLMHEQPQQSLIGVHVVEGEATFPILRYHAEEEVRAGALVASKRAIESAMAGDWMGEPQVILGDRAEKRLATVVPLYRADGLIVGRQARAGEVKIDRLGRCARRLVRNLPAPLFIVPPDWRPSEAGSGPVIAASALRPESIPAARFAKRIGARIGRDTLVAHVVPQPDDTGVVTYIPDFSWDRVRQAWHDDAVERLIQWSTEHEIDAERRVVEAGITHARLIELAEREKACMIVCGSRSLNAVERVFSSSVSVQLAAGARVPVCVVPPGWTTEDAEGDEDAITDGVAGGITERLAKPMD